MFRRHLVLMLLRNSVTINFRMNHRKHSDTFRDTIVYKQSLRILTALVNSLQLVTNHLDIKHVSLDRLSFFIV